MRKNSHPTWTGHFMLCMREVRHFDTLGKYRHRHVMSVIVLEMMKAKMELQDTAQTSHILLSMCDHTLTYIFSHFSCCYTCSYTSHTAIHLSLCPHNTTCVSSYYYIRVLVLP